MTSAENMPVSTAFDVMEDLHEAQDVLTSFIAQPATRQALEQAIAMCVQSLANGHKIIAAGNGGSMCDALHFAEELSGRYRQDRPALAAISISDPSHITCVGNDYGFEYIFARFLEGVGCRGDVFLGISTSGNSLNVIRACEVCPRLGLHSLCLLGKDGGQLGRQCDLPVIVPHSGFADRIQEIHTLIIHILIRGIERQLCS